MKEQKQLFELLKAAVTPFHCVEKGRDILNSAGFETISYEEEWNLVPGGKYVMEHYGTSLGNAQNLDGAGEHTV